MRVLLVAALVTLVGVLTGFGVHEWRSPEKPRQITPIDLRPALEREPRNDSQRHPEERPTKPSTSGAPPAAPSPPVGGQRTDAGGDEDGGDDGGHD
jgi:hypothetical protein